MRANDRGRNRFASSLRWNRWQASASLNHPIPQPRRRPLNQPPLRIEADRPAHDVVRQLPRNGFALDVAAFRGELRKAVGEAASSSVGMGGRWRNRREACKDYHRGAATARRRPPDGVASTQRRSVNVVGAAVIGRGCVETSLVDPCVVRSGGPCWRSGAGVTSALIERRRRFNNRRQAAVRCIT